MKNNRCKWENHWRHVHVQSFPCEISRGWCFHHNDLHRVVPITAVRVDGVELDVCKVPGTDMGKRGVPVEVVWRGGLKLSTKHVYVELMMFFTVVWRFLYELLRDSFLWVQKVCSTDFGAGASPTAVGCNLRMAPAVGWWTLALPIWESPDPTTRTGSTTWSIMKYPIKISPGYGMQYVTVHCTVFLFINIGFMDPTLGETSTRSLRLEVMLRGALDYAGSHHTPALVVCIHGAHKMDQEVGCHLPSGKGAGMRKT